MTSGPQNDKMQQARLEWSLAADLVLRTETALTDSLGGLPPSSDSDHMPRSRSRHVRRRLKDTLLARDGVLRYFELWWGASIGAALLLCLLFPSLRSNPWVSAFVGVVFIVGIALHFFIPAEWLAHKGVGSRGEA